MVFIMPYVKDLPSALIVSMDESNTNTEPRLRPSAYCAMAVAERGDVYVIHVPAGV